MNKPNGTGVSRILAAARCSAQGFRAVFRHEVAFRQELLASLILLPVAFWLANTPMGVSIMLSGLLLVLLVEVLNSGLEAVVDRIGLEPHDLSGRAKDLGSLAVTLAIILCVVLWLGVVLSGI